MAGAQPKAEPEVPAYLRELLLRGAAQIRLRRAAIGVPVAFRWWADGHWHRYLAHMEWASDAEAPRVVVVDPLSGWPVCRSLIGRLFDIDPSPDAWCIDPPADEIDRFIARREGRDKSGRRRAARAGDTVNHYAELLGTLGELRQELEAVRGQVDALPPEYDGELPYRVGNSMEILDQLETELVSAEAAHNAEPATPQAYVVQLSALAAQAPGAACVLRRDSGHAGRPLELSGVHCDRSRAAPSPGGIRRPRVDPPSGAARGVCRCAD